MARMVRKQIYITKDQDATLKRVAAERGQTEAEVVRACLEGLTSGDEEPAAERIRVLDEFMERMRHRAELYHDVPPMNERGWTRDEIYEDRLQKIMPRR